jgi:hypothetical protein
MATRTKPLVTAATLASAAAIAIASPAIAPSLNLPTPHALSAAKVQLATFADVLSVPAVEWTDLLFGNTSWGGVLTPDNYGPEWAAPSDQFLQYGYVNPWATYCNGNCDVSGISGAAYLFADALVNGNDKGYDNSDQWNTGFVNYLFEPNSVFVIGGGNSPYLQYVTEGWSAATWYALQGTIGQAVPELTVPIAALFWGPQNLSVAYNAILTGVAAAADSVPGVGPFVGNSILAYLGNLLIEGTQDYYQYGLSGALNYWTDIATGAVPFPTAAVSAAAARVAAATPAAPAVVAATVTAPESPAIVSDLKPAVDASESTPAADAKAPVSSPAEDTKAPVAETPAVESTSAGEAPKVEAPESTPAVKAPEVEAVESTPAAEAPESTPEAEAPEVKVVDSTPAVAETKPVEAPEVSVPDVKDITPAVDVADSTPAPAKAKAPAAVKHPVRDAVEKVSKQINSAINGAKAGSAKAGSADSAS